MILRDLAEDALATFERIVGAALALSGQRSAGVEAFASINGMNAAKAVENLGRAQAELASAYRHLRDEPAIARVVVADENDRRETLYICRATPVTCHGVQLCSSLGPKGRLAALPVGEFARIRLPSGFVDLEVVEKSVFKPACTGGLWDSRPTVFQSEGRGPLTITSLRELLAAAGYDDDDLDALERQLADDDEAANVVEGLRRAVLTAMQLRDQPILDKFQDEIFRLPLDSRLAILGPPGTGKTTTLVRRLRQKIDFEFLSEEEQELADAGSSGAPPHNQSWLMFTPTELLKQYVKEAFAREGVAAPEQRIRTWSDHRRDLARRSLPILRSASGGSLVINERVEALLPATITDQIAWFEDFDLFQATTFLEQVRSQAETVASAADPAIARIGGRALALLSSGSSRPVLALASVSTVFDDLRKAVSGLNEEVRQRLRRPLAKLVASDQTLLDDLARFISTLSPDLDEDDSEDEGDDEDEVPQQGRRAAQDAFLKALRARAVSEARKRPVARTSRAGKILQWLAERGVTIPNMAEVGELVVVQRAARLLLAGPTALVKGVPARYRGFRRARMAEGRWYRESQLKIGEVTPLEIDVILLGMLRNAAAMHNDTNLMRRLGDQTPQILGDVTRLQRNQILVDEATDFSPIQLACMAALGSPWTNSFFACGDFNQRLTVWGARSTDHLRWIFPDIAVREIDVAYRQSRRLNELAGALAATDGNAATRMPEHLENEGVKPVFGANLCDMPELIDWLAARICEIEDFSGQLPSIAVLVNDRTSMAPLAAGLSDVLEERNIRAVACPDGQVMGQENDVRVFEVEHIKGLEFEAVFFIDIDRLEKREPDLFDKYIYVGATRAATYLGMTCSDPVVPASLSHVQHLFGERW
ncbi:ATP-binding domain-containing protein [Sphingomonas phyllosphaerae]|uniref:ATP-binding domain-containing protein n=1 Tax=Sphingomonas phyllosphaerae TaxID=257003 RepID=UPI0024137FD8|nr:ATP-binding domain-containing protein [Sphingomonas phyllosphaerae]